jgi:hypothetical protein
MKYTSKAKLKYVLVKNDKESKPFKTIYDIYKASDTYSGVHYAKGGLTDAKYVSKRNSQVVDDNGKIVSDKLNGVWLKETAKPVGSIEGTEAMELKTAADWENYLKGGSGSQEVGLTPNVIRKGMYGWKGKTYSKGQINGYDWDITTIKVSSGKLVSSIQGGSRSKGDGYESFQFTMFQDPSANLIVTAPKVVNEKRVREQHEQAVEEFKRMVREGRLPEKKYGKGGKISKSLKEKYANLNYQVQSADLGWIKNNPEEYEDMISELQKLHGKIYGTGRISKYADGGEIVIKSGSNGNLKEVFRREKNQRNELLANEIFDEEKLKGNSVFLMVDGELYDSHTASGDEDSYAEGGSIGFIPMDMEEDLRLIGKWGDISIKQVIGLLNAMIDSGVTDEDLVPKPTKNTSFQREKAEKAKIKEIWTRIEPNYKGDLIGNRYYSSLKELIGRNWIYQDLLKKYKPLRKLHNDEVEIEREEVRKMSGGDAVLYKDEQWYVTEKNGQLGIGNFRQGAWGMDFPFISLSRIDMDSLTDMMGRKVQIVKGYAKGGTFGAGNFAEGGLVGYANQNYDDKIGTFNSLLEAKKFAKANKWKYDTMTFEDDKGDNIVVTKSDTFKDIDWLFSDKHAKGGKLFGAGHFAEGGEISFDEFIKDTILTYPSRGWDANGNALVDITLKSKPSAAFDYKYSAKSVVLDDFITDRKLRIPIQIRKTIYDKFYKSSNFSRGGNFAEGGKLENISPILKPKIEAIEKILPKALGESSLTIEFAFQTNTGYAFNMISRTDLPVNRATPKLKKIGVEVERTGEKGRRLITIPRGIFDKMTAIYADGGLIEDLYNQRRLTDIQIRTQLVRILGVDRASDFMARDNNREHGVSAMSLLLSAVSKGWLSVDEIDFNMYYAAESAADETAELEEIGSSDLNFILKEMLEDGGIEMGYEGNRIVRKYSNPEEVNIKDKTHRNGK